jgi:hypothetical protein
MKRLLSLAMLATAALASSATPSFAGTFGLFYCGRWCNCCDVCIRPYNAFSPVCCGMGEIMGGGGSKWGKGCGCGDDCGWRLPYFGSICSKGCCCSYNGMPIPEGPAIFQGQAPTAIAGYMPSAVPAGVMARPALQPVSYQPSFYPPAYSAYPVYPMGYAPAPVWGGYPMPAYYPAQVAPSSW